MPEKRARKGRFGNGAIGESGFGGGAAGTAGRKANPPGYKFTKDWFSHGLANFETFLSRFKGKPAMFLEIGTHEGRCAAWLLDHILTHPKSELHCVDPCWRSEFFHNARLAGTFDERTGRARGLTFHNSTSVECLRRLPLARFDFVYIDGHHSDVSVLHDAVNAFQLLKNGGMMAFDDYLLDDPTRNPHPLDDGGTPRTAVDAFLAVHKACVKVEHADYQVWIRKTPDRRKFGTAPASDTRPGRRKTAASR